LGDRGIEDPDGSFPDVGAGTVAFDERQDRIVGNFEAAGRIEPDSLAAGRNGHVFVGRHLALKERRRPRSGASPRSDSRLLGGTGASVAGPYRAKTGESKRRSAKTQGFHSDSRRGGRR